MSRFSKVATALVVPAVLAVAAGCSSGGSSGSSATGGPSAAASAGTPVKGGNPSAICAQTDPELWFPDRGGSTREAKRMCKRCPLFDDCLDMALADPSLKGVWGGTSEVERRAMRQEVAA